jgi:hypothetical protein
MQKHKFSVTCPGVLFMETVPDPTKHEKIMCRRFAPQTQRNALHDPKIPLDAKTQVRRNVSQCAFYGNLTGPTRA